MYPALHNKDIEEFFVLGDNREVSRDSREIGTIKKKDIKGRIIWYLRKL